MGELARTLADNELTVEATEKQVSATFENALSVRGAVDLIAQAGGGVVEGYPHVPGEKKMSSSFLYNGTRAMYERCGFDFVRPKGMKNTVMRRTVAPAG